MREAVRVALLARPGAGADRLRDALQAAGASLVLEADPTTLEPATLAAAGAASVVVLLDPAVEEALDRLDPVLHDPAIDVLYEEAELAAAREGWDAARWTRHLSAKLLRHGDVLPPGREPDAAVAPVAEVSGSAPAEPEFSEPARSEPAVPEPAVPEPAVPEPAEPAPAEPEPAPLAFDPVAAEYVFDGADEGAVETGPAPAIAMPEIPDVPTPAPPPAPDAPAAPAAPAAGDRSSSIRDFRRNLADIEQRIASMGLVDDGPREDAPGEAPAPEASPAPAPPPALSLDEAPPAPPAAAPPAGAVLVYAGIGGPDAVRQFLGALPPAFPRPVLILQRLDGGRHDRLVQQMARATSLPVELAAQDQPAAPGHVYILPPELGLAGEGGLHFVAGGDPLASLPAADSAVLMFSGSDTGLVDAAMQHAQAGALVAGQSPDGCYDAAASDALVARGAESGQPADLARRLAERWAA